MRRARSGRVLRSQWFEGKEWDFVFDVDIADGAPPLKLAMQRDEDPYEVAERFLLHNNQPLSYREQIVRFIVQNTTGASLSRRLACSRSVWSDAQALTTARVFCGPLLACVSTKRQPARPRVPPGHASPPACIVIVAFGN